ncbi:MAG: hypothetical protein MJK14_18570, partial [Rivularia sp. ALOHA_DT_140]|nr:hypothetical protein [Rivularia sp. ALOHA_DT_140]
MLIISNNSFAKNYLFVLNDIKKDNTQQKQQVVVTGKHVLGTQVHKGAYGNATQALYKGGVIG